MNEKILIFPEPGNVKVIARLLLDLADKPLDVEYVLWPQEGFRVSEELALKFEAQFTELLPEGSEPISESVPVADAVREDEPVKRKPGRPKKEAQ